jgi:S1-C subfamily serine protease
VALDTAQADSQTSASLTNPVTTDSEVIDPASTLELSGLQQRFEAVASKVAGSVVAISAAEANPPDGDESQAADPSAFRGGSLLATEEMNPDKLRAMLEQTTRTVGTGFVVDSQGYILTNEHVVGGAAELWVTTSDHKVWPAMVVGSDPRTDLAVLRTPAANLRPVKFAAEGTEQRGEWTIALGNPYGLAIDGDLAMSVGIVAALERSLPRLAAKEDRLYSRLIQTTAEINPGNSGGPLFDIDGQVIGINTAVILPQKQTNGIGFAIPVTSRLLTEVRELEAGKDIVYGYLGVTVAEPTESERAAAGANADEGVRVEGIEAGSPAVAADIRVGDFLVSLNGTRLSESDQFIRAVGDCAVGQSAQIDVLRGGKRSTIYAIPKRRPAEIPAVTRENQRLHWRGIWIGSVTDAGNDAASAGLRVMSVEANCPLKGEGACQGARITSVAGRPVGSLIELLQVINDAPSEDCAVSFSGPATRPVQ